MASNAAFTIVFTFWAVFWCLQLLQSTTTGARVQPPPQGRAARLAAAALLPALVTTFGLNVLLLIAHVRAIGRTDAAAAGVPGRRTFLQRLCEGTLAAAVTALLAGGVLRLVADGYDDFGGADDVGWLKA